MKNVPKKCLVCKGPLIMKDDRRMLQCKEDQWHFLIEFNYSGDITYWDVKVVENNKDYFVCNELGDNATISIADSSFMIADNSENKIKLNQSNPYITGKAVYNARKILKKVLKLKAFF